ncbi:MAG: ferrous iron transport protein B [Saprospiraceae bacterium]|nr:ferrous iron transport protein B [Saprospiraceae bacterium]
MTDTNRRAVALVGNPNAGKSSIFNQLTGLRQQTANFPGVTVEKKIGVAVLDKGTKVDIIDLPGCYSLYPNSKDEKVVLEILTDKNNPDNPDLIVYVADINHLERHLLLATQLHDLGHHMILVINMIDTLQEAVIPDYKALEKRFNMPVIAVSSKTGDHIEDLKLEIKKAINAIPSKERKPFYVLNQLEDKTARTVANILDTENIYLANIIAHHYKWMPHLSAAQRINIAAEVKHQGFEDIRFQIQETMSRFNDIQPLTVRVLKNTKANDTADLTDKIDSILTNRVAGPILFFALMMLMFQAVFSWAQYPMEWIETGFASAGNWVRYVFGQGYFSDLIVDGILAGLSGVLVFIPQITILFLLISVMEESGYMSRAVFMFDNIMQKFGLNGRSMVALISSGACAVPAIMSTRTISNWKERIITIMVAPLISCSARLPVYALLVAFVVPQTSVWGIFNAQGLVFMGLYLLGIVSSLVTAYVFSLFIKSDSRSHLMIELPQYKPPIWKNVFYNVKEKVWAFIWNAGKIIMLISILLWFLASFGPSKNMQAASDRAQVEAGNLNLSADEKDNLEASYKLEASYAGILGKSIEPIIRPLGFDWKIGIALITSFAAREVFVGTMATIYSVGSTEDELSIKEKMMAEKRPDTGVMVYTPITALSLLVFYVFAMQCMSTLAVTKKETGSWKWAMVQLTYLSALAYLSSLFIYQVFG